MGPRGADPAARSVNVEFVSANPTGPLHIGNARGAFVGDLLCRVLEAGGQQVTREYYFNDFGRPDPQPRRVGRRAPARRAGPRGRLPRRLRRTSSRAAVPDEVWAAATARRRRHRRRSSATGRPVRVRDGIEASLADLGVHFDVWTSEGSLHDEGWVERAVERLRERGHVYEQDGALWFRSTDFGDDKDRVIIRSNGEPTYFAADIGYVTEKFSRGFDHLIYIWGADHHGTVARVRNAAEAMGYDARRRPDAALLVGPLRARRGRGLDVQAGRRLHHARRAAREVGVDAARWFFASRSVNTGIDFDIELAKKQSNENPVYYVQYAHARIASILRKAAEAGLAPAVDVAGWPGRARPRRRWPGRSPGSRRSSRTPSRPRRPRGSRPTRPSSRPRSTPSTATRAWSTRPNRSGRRLGWPWPSAARITLANALGLLGISAPESM